MAQKVNQKQYGKKYSTTEQLTGDVWIDGKPIYRKTISLGTLPNATNKTVAHGITGLDSVISMSGIAQSGTIYLTLPYVLPDATNTFIRIYITGANLGVTTGIDRTSYTGTATLEYTKT